MNKSKLLIALAAAGLSFSQTASADAGGDNWSISGWINEAMIFYDDGVGSDIAQTSDNGTTLGSRITLAGSTDLGSSGLSAGFEVILEPQAGVGTGNPLTSSQTAVENTTNVGGFINELGYSTYLSGNFGKVTLGLQSMPTDNIAVLADPSLTLWSNISPLFRGQAFAVRGLSGAGSKTTWGSFTSCLTMATPIGLDCNGIYRNGIRYDLPAFGPVSVAVGYANDDIYDIAAKYNGELAGLKAILHLGYAINQGGATIGTESENFQVQGGLMDPGTGFFGTVAYQMEEADNAGANTGDDTDAWYTKVGIKKGFNSLGDTSIAFVYGSYNDQWGAADTGAGITITGSEVERIGFTVDQYFGSRFILYGTYENLSLDVEGTGTAAAYGGAQDLDLFSLGATFFF